MKLLFASDLHGSAFAAKKLSQRMLSEGAEKLILLGDLLYHGPRNDLPEGYSPKEVSSILNEMKQKILCVRGNCDAEVDQLMLEFPITAENLLLFLEGHTCFISHGHNACFDRLPALNPGDIFMQGHSHVKVMQWHEGILLLNPGSTSLPKDGSKGSYLSYEAGIFTLKDLENGEALQSVSI